MKKENILNAFLNENFKNPYIVVVTALKETGLSERVTELGANYFLTKPLSMDQIGAIVNQWAR